MGKSYLDIPSAFFLASFVQNTLVLTGLIMGRCLSVLPSFSDSLLAFFIGLASVLHASSNAMGVFCTNLVGAEVPIYDNDPRLMEQYPLLQNLGGYTWFLTGLMADLCMGIISAKKILFLLVSKDMIAFEYKRFWFFSYIGGLVIASPGIAQVIWLYLAYVLKVPSVTYDDYTAKIFVAARLIFLKGTDIAFFIEILQFAKLMRGEGKSLANTIPKTLEAVFYYFFSSIMMIAYLSTSNLEIVRLLRNLVNKGTEVASFLYLYYASLYEISNKSPKKTKTRVNAKSNN